VVVDGTMYTSGNWGRVYALDARTGAERWIFVPEVDGQYGRYACCDVVNRGVAVWKGRVYVAALDGWLYALDARNGKVLWRSDSFVDRKRPATVTGAPQVAGDVVVIGQGGADFADSRGYVSAFDLATGKLKWRFFTVPGDPRHPPESPAMERAAATWSRDSLWETGGGGTPWDAMAYDPQLDLLYVGTGNAAPFSWWDRSPGGGDNLYLASILAIRPKTGRLVWHYQTVPGERWDYTATQKMILADLDIGGRRRKVLMQAPKNGFFYVLDRATGELLSARPYAPVNWASGIDPRSGRPILTGEADYRDGPALVYPAASGAHNWQPMAFNPDTGLVYIPVIEGAMIFAKGYDPAGRSLADKWNVNAVFIEDYPQGGVPSLGLPPLAKVLKGRPHPARRAVLRAWDPVRARTVWEAPEEGFWQGGVMTTAGGLVIQGRSDGMLVFRDAASGKRLHTLDTGSSIMAAPMSYEIDGVQYVAVMAGYGGAAGWAFPPGSAAYKYGNENRILVFRLDGAKMPTRTAVAVPSFAVPPRQFGTARDIARGESLFAAHCARCHANTDRSLLPDLRRMAPGTHDAFEAIVLDGALSADGMGRFDDILTRADARAVHAYLIDQTRSAYRNAADGGSTQGRIPARAN
jgi:quinohemoprotein ethanol dehydrogenase